jgi:hypothetical protein
MMMSQNAAIDIAIGLVLMYLLLSLSCTVINEYIAARLNLRSKSLEVGLQQLLDDPALRDAFYEHGLVAGTKNALTKAREMSLAGPAQTAQPAAAAAAPPPAAGVQAVQPAAGAQAAQPAAVPARPTAATQSGQHPAYVSTNTFVLGLVGGLCAKQFAPGQSIPSFADVQTAIQNLPPSNIKDALVTSLTVAQGNFDQFRQHVATWFDDSMDRLSGAYRRHLKFISIVVGCVVAVILNADTFAVGRALWSDAALRAQMVQVAGETLKAKPSTGPTSMQTPNAQPGQPSNVNTAQTESPSLGQIQEKFNDADKLLRPLPIGWSLMKSETQATTSGWFWPLKVLGLFVTGLALSFGAPFWFDTLSKFMNVRAAGVKPQRQT